MPYINQRGGGGVPSAGNAPFTITETDATSAGLVVSTLGGVGVYALDIAAPHTTVLVDGDGSAIIRSDDNMQLTVQGTSDSGGGLLVQNAPTNSEFSTFASSTEAEAHVADSAHVTKAGMSTVYGLLTALNAAPADAALSAGQAALWFDQTNGAAKLMVKAKSANGTVATAAIALA